jgi:Glycosyl transferase family 2
MCSAAPVYLCLACVLLLLLLLSSLVLPLLMHAPPKNMAGKKNHSKNTSQPPASASGGAGAKKPAVDPHAGKPLVAVVTPTYGRHRFLPWLLRIFNEQTYPQSRMLLIILDDGPAPATDDPALAALLAAQANARYVHEGGQKLPIGAKRNRLNRLALDAGADVIVCMDDDDFYPRERVEHAVTTLARSGTQIAGSSVMYIYFADDGALRKFGPYGPYHATNGTFAFTRAFAETHAYDEVVAYAEETSFTRGFSEPLAQMDPFKTILCISHRRNTFDKSLIKASGAATPAKLADFVRDKALREFYKSLVQSQDANPEVLPGTQNYAPLDQAVQLD